MPIQYDIPTNKKGGILVKRTSDNQHGIIYHADVARLKETSPNDKRSPVHLVTPGLVKILTEGKPKKVLWNPSDYKTIGYID